MSIKAKLALLISIIATVILSLNISIYYFSYKNELRVNAEQQMITIAKQIGTTLEATERAKKYMEQSIAEKLRAVAISAQQELDPRIDHVTNEQLAELSRKLGVDHITLWVRTGGDIVTAKSSDFTEILPKPMSAKTWDYWFTAFNELFDRKPVTVNEGTVLPDYWSGPIQYSAADYTRIDKWGYYYDGTTDYMINPYVDAKAFLEFTDKIGTNALIRKLLTDNEGILGIAGFDPRFFGEPPITRIRAGVKVRNLDTRDVIFGEYRYPDEKKDVANVREAVRTGQTVSASLVIEGRHVLKSYIPLNGSMPYVIGVSFDESAYRDVLTRQLLRQSAISAGLILVTWAASYVIAGLMIRPLRQILRSVDEIAAGRLGDRIAIRSRDELGLLSSRVNVMADSLQTSMGQLETTAEELRGTKEYLESFVDHTSDAIHVMDLQNRLIRANRAFETMFGWSREEVLGHVFKHIPDEYLQETMELTERVLRGEPVADYETLRMTKDGNYLDISVTVSPIRDNRGAVVAIAVISRNITARKQTEEVIRRTEKLSVVGQLAAGVAHEIRNPLTTLRGFVQWQKQHGRVSDEHLDLMISELDRINLIVSEFLVLAKPQAVHREKADLQSLLQDIILLLDVQAGMGGIQICIFVENEIPMIDCEANQLKQVFINLLKNAVEAMPDGGVIRIELEHDAAGSQVLIRIRDEGVGIPESDLPRLGEPFFTSKPSGNGLGIMVSQRILANHKGRMSISSKPGEGTCVEVRLPLA